ncbi:hypothetical protein BGZ96_010985, partial [Linnemannia gamsii]
MEETQSFRLVGKVDIEKIPIGHVGKQSVVTWDDIEQVFPGVKHVKYGDDSINMLEDSNRNRIEPLCIKHYPGVDLEVFLSTTVEHVLVDSSISPSRLTSTDDQAETPTHAPIDSHLPDAIIKEFKVNPPAISATTLDETVSGFAIVPEPSTGLSSAEPRQATMIKGNTTHFQSQLISVTAAIEQARQSGNPLTSEALSSLIALKLTLASMAKSGFERTVIHKLDGLYDQGLLTQQIAQKVLELHKQMIDRLNLIQSKTEAILTQQLELTEYPTPRLFIVLPEEPVKYHPGNWFRTKFRLHFIREC